jgi:hypothetical protein
MRDGNKAKNPVFLTPVMSTKICLSELNNCLLVIAPYPFVPAATTKAVLAARIDLTCIKFFLNPSGGMQVTALANLVNTRCQPKRRAVNLPKRW